MSNRVIKILKIPKDLESLLQEVSMLLAKWIGLVWIERAEFQARWFLHYFLMSSLDAYLSYNFAVCYLIKGFLTFPVIYWILRKLWVWAFFDLRLYVHSLLKSLAVPVKGREQVVTCRVVHMTLLQPSGLKQYLFFYQSGFRNKIPQQSHFQSELRTSFYMHSYSLYVYYMSKERRSLVMSDNSSIGAIFRDTAASLQDSRRLYFPHVAQRMFREVHM